MRNVSDKSCREIKAQILNSTTFFSPENRDIHNVKKNIGGQATVGSMAHVHCMLDT
jgi:hypothetical protein